MRIEARSDPTGAASDALRASWRRAVALCLGGWAVVLSGWGSPSHAQLRAQVETLDITPPLGVIMAGYGAREGVADRVLDPLTAQVLVLEQGDELLAIATLDLRRFVSGRVVDSLRARGFDHVVLASSHTHSGPDADPDVTGVLATWRSDLEDRLIEAAERARQQLLPVRVAVGIGESWQCHNRRRVERSVDGRSVSVEMLWRNEDASPTWPVDPTLGVVRLDSDRGPLAVLVHYACHAVIYGPDNTGLSADWPGALRRRLAEQLSSSGNPTPTVLFLQGAAGDLNPYRDKQPVAEGARQEVDRVGHELAEQALVVWRRLESELGSEQELGARSADLVFENRWRPAERSSDLEARLVALRLASDAALVFFPGEPFLEHQITLRGRSPFDRTFLVGYATSSEAPWPGYLPTLEAAVEGGYGAGWNTEIEEGAGEVMVDRAVIELLRIRGDLEEPEAGASAGGAP